MITSIEVLKMPRNQNNENRRAVISDSIKAAMNMTLGHFSKDAWNDDHWDVLMPASQRKKTIRFPLVDPHDGDILRASALVLLVETGSVDAAQRVVREGGLFIDYLTMHGTFVENICTPYVTNYIRKMEEAEVSEAVIASRVRSAKTLFDTCIENNLVSSNYKVVFEYKSKKTSSPRRPPDSCVIDEVDRLALNLPDSEVPLTIRTLYLLMRMIPSRISELLSMNTECLKYIGKNLFSVSKPKFKETPQHIPVYQNFVFSLEGKPEAMLHRCLRELISINRSEDALHEDCDYLFYDSQLRRVLCDYDMNQFLAKLVAKYRIRNEDGSYPKVTTHTFKHVSIGDRLRSGVYTVEDAAVEAGHSDPNVTLGYGYPSKNDEAKMLGKIVEQVLSKEFGVQAEGELKKRVMSEAKYTRLLKNTPFLRLIPIVGACDNVSCKPQYVECINCDSFEPDNIYLDYFVEVRKIIVARLERLRNGGDEDAILFEEYELEIVEKFIAKMTKSSAGEPKKTKRREIIIATEEQLAAI